MNEKPPKIRAKTAEEIQAQVAAFAAEGIENRSDRKHVFKEVVRLADGAAEDETRVTGDSEYEIDIETNKGILSPGGVERTVAVEDYKKFLRSVGGSKHEGIKGRSEILSAYKDFATEIKKLKEGLKDVSNRKEHSAFLGSGSNASVFFIEKDGKKYAVRVSDWGEEIQPASVDQHLAAAFLSRGLPHLEQMVAASYEDGVTVAELMPGVEMGKLTVDDVRAITNDQLNELVDTLVTAHERGIKIDPKPSNFFYDREAGFGVVDLSSSKVKNEFSKDQDVGTVVGWTTTPLLNAGTYGQNKEKITLEDYAQDLDFRRVVLDVLIRYKKVVEEKLKGGEREVALKAIDADIKNLEESIANSSNPEWVAERIRQDEGWRKKKRNWENQGNQPGYL